MKAMINEKKDTTKRDRIIVKLSLLKTATEILKISYEYQKPLDEVFKDYVKITKFLKRPFKDVLENGNASDKDSEE